MDQFYVITNNTRALTEEEVQEIMEKRPITAVDAKGKLSVTWGRIKKIH